MVFYLLPPWSRRSWEANQFSAHQEITHTFETWRFITMFTSARYMSLSSARSIHSMPHHPTSWRCFNNILPSMPRSPYRNPVCTSPLSHTCYVPCQCHSSGFDHPNVFGTEYRSLSSSICSFLHFPVSASLLGPNILLKHPLPTFLPQCEWPSYTPKQNNSHNHSSLYLNLHIFG